ncbi:hypothetical protein SBRY_20120 [Actinacidiphila bryophytorum]|uniref:Uncharacterized protein n=1 Tax=Actinacidiphila bryophytorum TaxID=1436133 RepID=A0A9W4ED91_9ACTN|nr:hypothetical protein SBRY_20120 [Actinacidiphila bryophytorum]
MRGPSLTGPLPLLKRAIRSRPGALNRAFVRPPAVSVQRVTTSPNTEAGSTWHARTAAVPAAKSS